MSILTSSVQTFVDLTDQRKLSVYLTSNLPTVQIKDPNANVLNPNWKTTNLKITPVIYLEQEALIPGTTSGLTVAWKRKEGSSTESNLVNGKEAANTDGTLTISDNVLDDITSKMITYICRITYNDPDTKQTVNISSEMSFALIQNAVNAKLASIEGEQIFKFDENNTLVSSPQIVLTGTVQGVNIVAWQYKNASGNFVNYPTGPDNTSISTGTLVIKPGHEVFNGNTAVIKLITDDNNISDTTTITKLYDGVSGGVGAGGLSVVVGNEAHLISCTNAGAVVATTDITIPFYGYKGTALVNASLVVSGLPEGMTVKTNTPCTRDKNGTLILTVAANSTLGGALNGKVTLTFTIDKTEVVKIFSWSKSVKGNSGASSVLLTTYTPNGNVIQNGVGSVLIQSVAYEGTTVISSGATYSWKKYVDGKWTTMEGKTTDSITVTASDIINISSFECDMLYKDKTYKSVVTVIDKTDPCVSEMVPISGTTFKNGLGGTAIYVIVRRSGTELDPLKGKVSTVAPASPANNSYWWKVDEEAKECTLMKYSGSTWTAVTATADKQSLTYTWYKRGKTGETETFNKEGKVIYFSAEEVDSIATLQCDVSDNK